MLSAVCAEQDGSFQELDQDGGQPVVPSNSKEVNLAIVLKRLESGLADAKAAWREERLQQRAAKAILSPDEVGASARLGPGCTKAVGPAACGKPGCVRQACSGHGL